MKLLDNDSVSNANDDADTDTEPLRQKFVKFAERIESDGSDTAKDLRYLLAKQEAEIEELSRLIDED